MAGERTIAAVLAGSLVLVIVGLIRTDIVRQGLLEVWDRRSATRLFVFLAITAAVLGVGAWTRVARPITVVLVLAWLTIAFGVAGVAGAAGVLGAALGVGSAVTARVQLRERLGHRAGALVALATGLAVIVVTVQIISHSNMNTTTVYVPLAFLAMLAGHRWILADLRAVATQLRERPRFDATTLLVLVIIAAQSVRAALPEHGSDGGVTHLAVPTYVASHLHWGFDVTRYTWAVIPMGGDWLYTASFLLGGEPAVKLFNLGVQVAATALLHTELRRRVDPRMAMLLTAVFASSPLAFLESGVLFIETSLMFLVLAATVLVSRSRSEGRAADLVLVGLLLGAALATKLLALFAAVPLGLFALGSWLRAADGRRLSTLTTAGLVFAVAGLTPYAYAWVHTGNPVFPFMNQLFKSPHFPPEAFQDTRWMGHLHWKVLYEMTFRTHVFGEHNDGAFGFQHLLLLPAGLIGAVLSRGRAAWIAILTGLAYVVGVGVQIQYVRYLYPVFPLLALAQAEGLRHLSGRLRVGAMALCSLIVAGNVAFFPTAGWMLRGFAVHAIVWPTDKERYLDQNFPHRKLLRMASLMSGRSTRVLEPVTVGGFDIAGEPVYVNWYNLEAQAAYDACQTAEDMRRFAGRYQLTHVLLDGSAPLPALAAYLETDAVLVDRAGSFTLYRVLPPHGR